MTVSFDVHLVTLLVAGFARFAPQKFTLVGSGPAKPMITKRLAVIANFGVHFVNIGRAVLTLPSAILW